MGILLEAMNDGAGHLRSEVTRIQADATTPVDALRRVFASYVDFSLANPAAVDLLIIELPQLGDHRARGLRRIQHDYISAWVALLQEADPTLGPGPARVRVQAALTVTNDIARSPGLRSLPAIDTDLRAIGASILHLPHS